MRFYAEFTLNLKRRTRDGFALGYNIVFPCVLILLLGVLTRQNYHGEVSSYQYYSVVIIPFCTMMGIVTAAYAGKDDAYANVAQRILVSPISKSEIVLAKILAGTIVFSTCSCIVFLVMAWIYKISIVDSSGWLFLFYIGVSFCITAIGTWVGLGMKNFFVVKNIMTIPIAIFAIVGGTFFPTGRFQEKFYLLMELSPLTWVNRALFLAMYDHNLGLLKTMTAIFGVVGVIATVVAIGSFRKEEYLYGNLSGYEK